MEIIIKTLDSFITSKLIGELKMHELNTKTLIRRDSLSITDTDSLINGSRDTLANQLHSNDLESSEDFFDLEFDYRYDLKD